MASRRDELNAYTFAKKRTVASFLQPSPSGSEEGAPRLLRGFLPGVVVGALVLAGFGAWGMFKPQAPKGWDEPEKRVIVASDSTTRYVVLRTGKGKKVQLHPVLNLASARLLLDPDQYAVVKVAEKELDNGSIPHGPTIGIPYAPDRLPGAEEAGRAKRWAVCERPGPGGETERATLVLADRDAGRTDDDDRLRGGEVMYVEDDEGAQYLVGADGTKYAIGEEDRGDQEADERRLLVRLLTSGEPQQVSDEWLGTLRDGSPLTFPEVEGTVGEPAGVAGLPEAADRIGTVLAASTGKGRQQYLVEAGRVVPVSDFTAHLLLNSPQTAELAQGGEARKVGASSITDPAEARADAAEDWPTRQAVQANTASRGTVCSVLRTVHTGGGAKGGTTLSTWAGDDYPVPVPVGTTSAYVTPGSGVLFRQYQGTDTKTGGVFLVTDTGLRYAVQSNTDSGAAENAAQAGGEPSEEERAEVNTAQIRLGYESVEPVPVPAHWAQFLSKGPRLDTTGAKQPQGS